MGLSLPINFSKWVTENEDKLKPPVNNFCLYDGGDFTVMVVGGPNSRSDYHVNETEEWFYQVKGEMLLKVIENATVSSDRTKVPENHLQAYNVTGGEFAQVKIGEGEMFLLPVGIVIERVRPPSAVDRLRWYCLNPVHSSNLTVIREKAFECRDLGSQLKPLIQEWMSHEDLRKCPECGTVADP